MFKNLLVLVIILILALFANVAPKYFLDDNAEKFQGEEKEFALYSLNAAKVISAGRFKAYKIMELEKISDEKLECTRWQNGKENSIVYGDYRVKVRAYTLFGIPYADFFIECQNSSSNYFYNFK